MSIIALADCNNFFVSCERALDPTLEHQPVVVLSNNDGCIISRSNEAKLLGIRMGEPYFKIRAQLKRQNVRVFSANFALYCYKSVQVADSLAQFTPQMEFYSIDESFLNLAHVPSRRLREYAHEIQDTVRDQTGIPVSIGIAETKTLAKLANAIAKKNLRFQGVLNLYQSMQMDMALSRVPVEQVWGVGRRIAVSMQNARIYTARELRDANEQWILKRHNIVLLKTVMELRGQSCFPFQQARPPRKSVMYSRSFGAAIDSLLPMESAIAAFTARAAEKLREDGMTARHISVYIRTSRHIPQEERFSNYGEAMLPASTDCTSELIRAALDILRRLFREGYGYSKAVIGLHMLTPVSERQMNLFEVKDANRLQTLMGTLDRINQSFGAGTLHYAAERLAQKALSDNLSSSIEGPAWQSRQTIFSEAGLAAMANPDALPPISNRRPLLGFVHPVQG